MREFIRVPKTSRVYSRKFARRLGLARRASRRRQLSRMELFSLRCQESRLDFSEREIGKKIRCFGFIVMGLNAKTQQSSFATEKLQ